jgi:hypothetical protein
MAYPEFDKPEEILQWAGKEFVRLRAKGIRQAWRFYSDVLMRHVVELRSLITVENVIERALVIERFVADVQDHSERTHLTPQEALSALQHELTLDRSGEPVKDEE